MAVALLLLLLLVVPSLVTLTASMTFGSRTSSLELCPGDDLSFWCRDHRHQLQWLCLTKASNRPAGAPGFVVSVDYAMPGSPPIQTNYDDTSLGRLLNSGEASLKTSSTGIQVQVPFRRDLAGAYNCTMRFPDGVTRRRVLNVSVKAEGSCHSPSSLREKLPTAATPGVPAVVTASPADARVPWTEPVSPPPREPSTRVAGHVSDQRQDSVRGGSGAGRGVPPPTLLLLLLLLLMQLTVTV